MNNFLRTGAAHWTRLVILIGAPIFLIMAPVLIGQRIFANGDTLAILLPNLHFFEQALKTGESFLWNPYILGGFPSYASLVGGFFAPLNLILFKFLTTLTAYHVAIFINLVLAAIFTTLLLKEFGLSIWAQLLGALTFVFSQWFMVADLGVVNSFPILPLVFLLLWHAREKKWPLLAGGVVLGYMWLAAHYNWLAMILVASFFFSMFLGRRVLGKFVVMNLLGLAIGWVQLLPALIYSQFSAREASLGFAEASVGAITVFDLPRWFLPYVRLPMVSHSEALLYIGIIPLFFLLVGLAVRERTARFFNFLFLFCLVLSLKYSPLFWLLHKLPVLSSFRGPSRWMFIGLFAGGILAAFGLERFFAVSAPWRKIVMHTLGWLGLVAIASSVAASFVLALGRQRILVYLENYFRQNLYASTSQLPFEHYLSVIENMFKKTQEIFDFQNPRILFSILFLFVGILVIFVSATGLRTIQKRTLVAIATLNFVLVFLFFHPTIAREEWFRDSQSAKLVHEPAGRVFTFLAGFTEWSKLTVPYGENPVESLRLQAELLAPNFGIHFNVFHADGYENLMPHQVARLLALLGSDRATAGEKLADLKIPPEEKARIFASRRHLLDLLGIRYIISGFPLDESAFVKIGRVEATRYNLPVLVYENKTARPLLYFAEDVVWLKPDENQVYERLLAWNKSDLTIGECEVCPIISDLEVGVIGIPRKRHNHLQLTVSGEKDGLLVFTQNYLPGWEARIDGRIVPIYRVNLVHMGIIVPVGTHEIEFAYRYPNLVKYLHAK